VELFACSVVYNDSWWNLVRALQFILIFGGILRS